MPSYTPWTWSVPHGRHYSYLLADDGTILNTLWSGPAETNAGSNKPGIVAATGSPGTQRKQGESIPPGAHEVENDESDEEDEGDDDDEDHGEENEQEDGNNLGQRGIKKGKDAVIATRHVGLLGAREGAGKDKDLTVDIKAFERLQIKQSSNPGSQVFQGGDSSTQMMRNEGGKADVAQLPHDIQQQLKSLERRFIRTDPSTNNEEILDARYRRVAAQHHAYFFVPGRVFKMQWSEPAGHMNPGKTRNSSHFSTVWLGEQAFSEIRIFVVVRNKGTFSQCIPIQTYRGLGAVKPGVIMGDHGIIHTSSEVPNQLRGEALTKYSIRVHPSNYETLDPASRVNYGKAYAVEHNVKVLDIGMVIESHRYLLSSYFDAAMRA